jgi:hypothetical protein
MKKERSIAGILGLLLVFGLILCGCPNPTDGTPKGKEQSEGPETPEGLETPEPVDPAFWFGEIHAALIGRIGTVTSEEYAGDMGQIVNTQYVCNAINAKWGTSFVPVSGTALQAANVAYLLKLIDKANLNTTTFGTSVYATTQALDKTAVDDAVNKLWVPSKMFVAVGNNGKTAYSTNIKNWTASTMPSADSWSSVTYGNGKFVAVTYNNDKAAYSTNGINWTASTMPSVDNWSSITYGNGKFVVVAKGGTNAAYSIDGINWTASILPNRTDYSSYSYWSSVTYGNGKFVAVADGSDTAAYSTDGINWTASTMNSSHSWSSVTYGNGKFVAFEKFGGRVAYSTNGINWTGAAVQSLTGSDYVTDFTTGTYGDGKFIVAAANGNRSKAFYSTNAIDWTITDIPANVLWSSVIYGSGNFIVFGSDGNFAYSTDIITWSREWLPSVNNWTRITYGGD